MHATPRTLEVHDIELLVEERVESNLAFLHSGIEILEHLLIHMVNRVLVLAYLKELSQLFLCLVIRVEIHFQRVLKFVVSLSLFLFDSHWPSVCVFELLLLLEVGRFFRLYVLIFLFLGLIEFILSFLVELGLPVKDVEVGECLVLERVLFVNDVL